MICHYWYFKYIGYKFEPEVCNKCQDTSMMIYDLADLMILNIKGVDCRCFVFKKSKNTAIKMLNIDFEYEYGF